MYNYKKAIIDDIKNYLYDYYFDLDNIETATEKLYDELWGEDSVTGNGGDYYDTEDACSEYLAGNYMLLYEAVEDFDASYEAKFWIELFEKHEFARYSDCIIRLHLLNECLEQVIEEIKNNEV